MKIPYIPDDAPFNADQRAWLSGFLAGLHSRLAIETPPVTAAAAPTKTVSLHILYGTQTGNAERVAMEAAASARTLGLAPEVAGLDDITIEQLAAMERLIVVTSTYGEGEMPDNAQLFWEAISASTAPRLENLCFGVLALGDTAYDGFCQAGKLIDMRLEQLGATRILARRDCDIDYEDPAAAWIGQVVPLAAENAGGGALSSAPVTAAVPKVAGWSRKTPYPSHLAVNRRLSGSASAKEIRHYEFDLGDSGLDYEAGDALGVMPVNDPALVSLLLARLGADPQTPAGETSLETALTQKFEISTPSRDLIAEVERRAGNEELTHVLRNGDKEALDAFLWGKDICDLLALAPPSAFPATDIVTLLKPLQHRAYSISSSPHAAAGSVHLTIASVRYHADGRDRGGVCSTFLADRVAEGSSAGIFVSQNKSFRLPADNDAPVIMVGPGTGVAPFRAFLQERRARGAKGRNWLFFGDQHRDSDFIYADELSEMSRDGLLTRLDLAFSRDQQEKIYVQTRMREHGKALFTWLEEGAAFYVCGDASRMARDVDTALTEIIATHGGLPDDRAADYVARLKREKRYLRDVY
ncbi:sulfite reductase subunit alpha [Shinella sp. 838]|uniref:sulfite reductase subunit alpha n=1 Tax=unclassified Shinella TaxID=2643062 RepID=UPI0003C56C4E|nr:MULTISPECIES: sulfite reductase subunit alpha [unclassified Shinella]EYR81274.1 sulfite reductase flavoprotein alpha-component CysJ [Shinella sp. DD12]MCA0338517.1 sulfite reductase subunit alpha [Pseudomonadota bacterium]MDG4675348.1 sulfite reductase subunit alpha [Shinella sp. 838]